MKKFSLLISLLFVSVMGFAIDWSGYAWIGNGSGNAAYTDAMKIDLPGGFTVVNLQSSFGTEAGIYITTPSDIGLTCDLPAGKFATQGTGMLLYLSAFTLQETPVTVTSGGTDYVVTVYWKDGTTGGGGGADPFDPTSVDWTSSVNTTTYYKVNDQFQIAAENAANMPTGPLNIQQPAWAAFEGLYVEVPAGVSACAFDDVAVTDGTEYDGNTGAGIVLNPSALTNAITKVTVTHGLGTTTFYVHNANAGSGGGGSIDWGEVSFVPGSSQYKVGALSPSDMPNEVVNIQKPGWAEEQGIYMTFPSADQLTCDLTCAVSGAGMVVYLSNFLGNEETEVNVTWNGGSKTFYVYNNAPMTLPSTKAPAPAVSAQRVRAVYSQYTYNTGMTMLGWSSAMTKTDVRVEGRQFPSFRFGNYLGLGYGTVYVSNMDNIHLDIWTENSFNIDFYLISPGTENAYTIELTGGTWNSVNIPLSTFSADKTRVTEFKFANATVAGQTIFLDNIYFYANADLPDPDPTEVEDTNFALRTNGAIAYASSTNGENYSARAIDGDNGTLWESQWDVDPQTLTIDLGQRRIFNIIQMRLYERHPRDFYIETSSNGVDWTTRKTITDQTADVVSGTEYTVELDANVTARYVRFRGTARANGYGYALYEFRVLLAGVPVLTSVTLSSDKKIAKVGTYATLTAEPKDQNSSAIAATLTYTVSPADAGHVTDGKYYPEKYGLATITVTATTASDEVSNMVQVWGVVSDNLALNNALSEVGTWYGTYTSSRAVDGNDGTEWQGSTANGNIGDSRIYDAWFVVDLKANYNIQLISIHFEGACSDAYKIYASSDNVNWDEAYNYSGTNGIYNHTDYISTADLNNADNARYIKFLSTKAATDYGMKIYEMEIYGAEASSTKTVSATVTPVGAGTVTITAAGTPVTEVPAGTLVTFTAANNSGYDFVNWTQGGVEVSTDLEYETTITSNTALVANFEVTRTAYCATPVTDVQAGRTLYLTISRTENANEYKILLEGSADNKITSDNVYVGTNLTLGNVNGESSVAFTRASGEWHVTSDGFGSAYITFTAANFRNITFINKGVDLYRDMSGGGGDLSSFNAFPDASIIKWDATCVDDEAPVLAAPVATPLSGTSVRLALSATDNMSALLTYHINYKPTGDAGAGTDVDVPGTAGETTYHNIKGLTGGTNYMFSVTVSDAVPNTSAAQTCSATPAMATAPVPTREAVTVLSVYSDAYTSALAHDFIKNNWAWPTYVEQNISGDHLLVYTSDPAIQAQMPDVAWGTNNDGDDAIIAKDGYNDGTNKGLDVRSMVYLHFDMWSAIATIYPEVYLNDDKLAGFELDGSGWQSFDIPLSSLTAEQKNNVRFIKFIALRTPNPEEIAIDNVYFWTDAAPTYTRNDAWMAPGELGTVCYPEGLRVAGATMYQMAGTDANGKFVFDEVEVLAPGVPYLFEAQSNELRFYATAATPAAEAGTSNGMVGTFTEITIPQNSPNIYYFTGTKFYAVTARSTDLTVPANRAYVDLTTPHPAVAPKPGIRRITFDVQGTNTITGVDNINASDAPAKILIDGQMYILRGEKLYDATGRLVK